MSSLPPRGDSRQPLLDLLRNTAEDGGAALEEYLERTPEAHAVLLRLLTELDYREPDARDHWRAIRARRIDLSERLGRDVSIQLAVLDYFQNVTGELGVPKILDMSTYLQTEKNAITDGLTGLYNRQFFDASLRRELKRARRYGLAFSLVMLDVDDFKSVNDAYGHPVGDEALGLFSDVIRANVREIDVASRYGGEEFALILPETSRTGAFIVSERIRVDVKEMFQNQRVSARHIDLSVSGGIAIYPTDSNSAEGLLRMADRALYRSKHEGKDKITLHAEEKRRSPRLEARQLLIFRERRRPDQRRLKSEAKNLSRNGALLATHVRFNVGTELEINISLPQHRESLSLKGRVVRLEEARDETGRPGYHVGVAFVADTEEDVRRIDGLAAEIYRPFDSEGPAEDMDRLG